MKKVLIFTTFLIFALISNIVYSQEKGNEQLIKPFHFNAVKNYPNGNKIAYFYLEGITNTDEEEFIQYKMLKLNEINRFIIYVKKYNKNYCLIECPINISEEFIYKNINKFANDYKNGNRINNTFPKFIDTGNPQEDNAKYDKAKRKWIEENPEEYNQLAHPNGVETNESKKCK